MSSIAPIDWMIDPTRPQCADWDEIIAHYTRRLTIAINTANRSDTTTLLATIAAVCDYGLGAYARIEAAWPEIAVSDSGNVPGTDG